MATAEPGRGEVLACPSRLGRRAAGGQVWGGGETKEGGRVLAWAAGWGAAALTEVQKPQEERKCDGPRSGRGCCTHAGGPWAR